MPKTEFTENMRRFCRENDLQDNPAIYIAEAIDKGDLSHDELKALIADDHNLLDAATVNYLVSNKIISESELENDCGIDRGFVDMLGTPITEMIDVEGSIDHIDEGSLEVYLWGIPSSGKTCALGSILCAAKTNRNVVLSVEPVTNNAHDFGYESKLESIFTNNGDFCVLPGRTPVKTNFAIGLQLEDLKNEVHPVTLIDMAGELFCYLLHHRVRCRAQGLQRHAARPIPHHGSYLLEEQRGAGEPHRRHLCVGDQDRQGGP